MTMEFAGETLSDARMASEGTRATGGEKPYEKIETGRALLPRGHQAPARRSTLPFFFSIAGACHCAVERFMKAPHLVYFNQRTDVKTKTVPF